MERTVQSPVIDEPRIARPAAATPAAHSERVRRRTLGMCAHCHRPVDFADEYVRLYRRAWHLDCALVSEGRSTTRNFD